MTNEFTHRLKCMKYSVIMIGYGFIMIFIGTKELFGFRTNWGKFFDRIDDTFTISNKDY